MRWGVFLLSAAGIATASVAHAAVEVRELLVRPATLAQSAEGTSALDSIIYPGRTVFFARLRGLEIGRTYGIGARVFDAERQLVGKRNWALTATTTEQTLSFEFEPPEYSVPGEWRLAVGIDAEAAVAQKTVRGVRRVQTEAPAGPVEAVTRAPPPTPPAQIDSMAAAKATTRAPRNEPPPAPSLKLTRALVTRSLDSKNEPRRPVDAVGLRSVAYYYVEASGFVPKRTYQVHLTVADGAGARVGDYHFSTRAWRAEHAIWYPLRPAATQAPGVWRLRLELDDQLLAETQIHVDAAANRPANDLERWWPVVAAALFATLAYMGWAVATAPRGPASPALPLKPPARALDGSLAALIAANLLPLALVRFAGANAADLLLLYWCENLVVGVYAILRMLNAPLAFPAVLALVPFFAFHFGLFTFVHYFFVVAMFGDQMNLVVLSPQGFHPTPGQLLLHPLESFDETPVALALQVAVLIVSHGISFAHNYMRRGEYLSTNVIREMMRPYVRLIAMHVALILGGFVAFRLGSPLGVLMLLVVLKTGFDIYGHLRPQTGRFILLR